MNNLMNRIRNAGNPYQGKDKKVLCVCSAGLLRSPTTARILSQEPYNFNTRAAGVVHDYALIPVDPVLISWADEIVFMEQEHLKLTNALFEEELVGKDVVVLEVPDKFPYMDEELVSLIRKTYDDSIKEVQNA